MKRFYNRLKALLYRRQHDKDLQDELTAHLRMDVQDRIEAGYSPAEARQAARRDFGNPLRVAEDTRAAWGWGTLESLGQDLRYAIHVFLKSPRFATIALLTLALCIGGNTAIFSVINGPLLEPLPYEDTDRLMVVTESDGKTGEPHRGGLSYVNALDWIERQRSFTDMALFRSPVLFRALTPNGTAVVPIRMVSANIFSILGVKPLVGRDFTARDDQPEAPPTIILSYAAWLRHFGGSYTNIQEQSVEIDRQRHSVIGVLPRDFTFYGSADAYIPIRLSREPWITARERRPNVMALGRLRPDVTREQAQSDLQGIARELASRYPQANNNRGAAVTSILDDMVGKDLRSTLYFLFAAVGCVLLIACANIANLLLAGGKARQKEIALRCSLGAGRSRVVRQLIMESLVLAVAGGAVGLFIAIAGMDLLVLAAPGGLPRMESIGIHWPVLLFSLGISMVAGVVFGLAPAWQAVHMDVNASLKQGGTSSNSSHQGFQRVLVVVEVSLALVVVLAAGLVLRSTMNALEVDPGFNPKGIVSFAIVISPNEYATGKEVHDVYRNIEERVRAIPGVDAVSMAVGNLPKPIAVNRDYLSVTGIRLLEGRFFDETDALTSRPVVVIDEMLAKARFPGISPIGKQLEMNESFGLDAPHREIIGVVNHITRFGIETESESEALNQFYFSTEQVPDEAYEGAPGGLVMLIRSKLDFGLMTSSFRSGARQRPSVQSVVRQFNPNLEISRVTLMKDAVERALAPRRFVTKLLGVFAFVALFLAALGIYGVTAYTVSQRTQEIGVRVALGAASPQIVRMIVGQVGQLAAGGIVVGLLASFSLAQFISHLMFGIGVNDPLTYTASAIMLFGIALIAAYVPAHQVTRLVPMAALRGDPSGAIGGRPSFSSVEDRPAAMDVIRGAHRRTNSQPVIQSHNLSKTFRSFRGRNVAALRNVSLSVESGTIFGLIGQNGAGKSTLVKVLLGLSTPGGGSARLLGCRPGDIVARRRVGYLPEAMRIPDHFTGHDFLHYMGRLNGVDRTILHQRIPGLLEKVGIGGVQKPVKNYSKGMQQRLGLAQALVNDPEVLFLDEPTDGLDPLGRINVRDLLIDLRSEGKTIFLNSHLLSEIELVCDRIVILDKGMVACTTTPEEFTRGTGEYLMRISPIDQNVRALAESLVGPCVWTGDTLRFRPRDLAQLNELLDILRRLAVQIITVEPVQLSLEKFFIQVVSNKDQSESREE